MTQLGMTSKSGGNVFADLGFAPAEAENLRIRAAMMRALISFVRTSNLTHARAAKLLRVSPQQVSDLMSGKIYLFSIDNCESRRSCENYFTATFTSLSGTVITLTTCLPAR
jgi:predicted XRE-type DNA-binding protein